MAIQAQGQYLRRSQNELVQRRQVVKVWSVCCVLQSLIILQQFACLSSFVLPPSRTLIRYYDNEHATVAYQPQNLVSDSSRTALGSFFNGLGNRNGRNNNNRNSRNGPRYGGGGGAPTRTRPGSQTVREVPYFIDPVEEAPFRVVDDRRNGNRMGGNNNNNNRYSQPPRQNRRGGGAAPRRSNNIFQNQRQPQQRTTERGIPEISQPKPWDFLNPFSNNNNRNNNNNRRQSSASLVAPTRRPQQRQGSNLNYNTNSAVSPYQQRSRPTRPSSGQNVNLSEKARTIWEVVPSVRVQGTVQKTWSFTTGAIDRVHVMMRTDGRPLSANVELWRGPDNSPQIMAVYIEDGALRPFNAIIETPGSQNVISVRNTNSLEFPLNAIMDAELTGQDIGLEEATQRLEYSGVPPRLVQGGSVYTKGFDSSVASVQLQLKTDGRPLCARIELLQGPNNSKQVMDVYTENGLDYPLFMVLETPGSENVFRIVNTATVEYPLYATLQAYEQAEPDENMARLFYSGPNSENAFDVERIL